MSRPTARELLDAIKNHEEFLEVTDWTREPDNLTFALAARVERVLALHQPSKFFKTPVCIECGVASEATKLVDWPCPTVRLLDGE